MVPYLMIKRHFFPKRGLYLTTKKLVERSVIWRFGYRCLQGMFIGDYRTNKQTKPNRFMLPGHEQFCESYDLLLIRF